MKAVFLILIRFGKSGLFIRVVTVICFEGATFSLVFVTILIVLVIIIIIVLVFVLIVLNIPFIILALVVPVNSYVCVIFLSLLFILGFLPQTTDLVLLHERVPDGNASLRRHIVLTYPVVFRGFIVRGIIDTSLCRILWVRCTILR